MPECSGEEDDLTWVADAVSVSSVGGRVGTCFHVDLLLTVCAHHSKASRTRRDEDRVAQCVAVQFLSEEGLRRNRFTCRRHTGVPDRCEVPHDHPIVARHLVHVAAQGLQASRQLRAIQIQLVPATH